MIAQSFTALLAPEITLTVGACVVLLLGVLRSDAVRVSTGPLSVLTVLAALALTCYAGPTETPISKAGMQFTSLVWYVRLIALSIGLIVLLTHWHLPQASERGDVFGMILFSLTGILMTSVADDLVLLFLAIELVSVPTYILVSVGRSDIRAQEAGVKYFFLGAMAAALLVYGFSFLYGASGTTSLSTMQFDAAGGYLTIGLLLSFAGVAFKIAAVPFHAYAADVYQGAASPVTGLLGFFPKLAGFVALIKLLLLIQPAASTGAAGWDMPNSVFIFLYVVSAATMTIGNVLALMQTNVKRMLGYSSIAHSGYMLIGLLVGPVVGGGPLRNGLSAMLFYIVAYGVMNLGAFAVLALLQARGRAVEELDDLAGLSKRSPLIALGMAICAFSLMGMPPTAGFMGKVYIFTSALSAGPNHPHQTALIILAVVGVVNSAIAAAYYLRIVAACYISDDTGELIILPETGGLRLGLICCCLVLALVGIRPQGLITMVPQSFHAVQDSGALTLEHDDAPTIPAPTGSRTNGFGQARRTPLTPTVPVL